MAISCGRPAGAPPRKPNGLGYRLDMTLENKRLNRIALDVSNALKGARVVRQEQDLFGSQPFDALATGILIGSLAVRLAPDLSQDPFWPVRLFGRLSDNYGALVGADIAEAFSRVQIKAEENEPLAKLLKNADQWVAKVSVGDPEADYLSDVVRRLGEGLLFGLTESEEATPLAHAEMSDRVVEMFAAGMTVAGKPLKASFAQDRFHLRKAAFAEAALMSSTTMLCLRKIIDYSRLGQPNALEVRLVPQTYGGHFLKNWLSLERTEKALVSPLEVIDLTRNAWGPRIRGGAVDVLLRIEKRCALLE